MHVGLLMASALFLGVADAPPNDLSAYVVPIDWKRFDANAPLAEDTERAGRLLLNAIRCNLAWASETYEDSSSGDRYIIPRMNEHGIRPPASAAFGIATGLMTGAYDETIAGVPAAEARRRALKLIKGVAATHRVNGDPKAGWGEHWQSAMWATLVGEAGWMLWADLDAETRRWLPAVVEYEADRFVRPDYSVPYWNGQGGDTKAEENAWNATVLQLAVAMMPKHPHVPRWKQIGSELMVSAFAKKADMESNETVLDGKPVKAWLAGYNIRDDGALVNHNLIHCDYMTTFSLNLRAFATLSLAGQPVPETADFNAKVLYACLARHDWPSPPYDPPGGTMYVPGKAEVYYPQGTDWSRFRFPVFYKADTYADFFGWDKDWPHRAAEWMRIRAERLLDMQARHEDRRVFADGEFDKYAGREQMACWVFADAFLLRWLADHKAVSQQANWNLP